jgi:putative ABC transport system permease protein
MRLYKALLRVYPAAFRIQYEDELCLVFASRRRDASNVLAIVALWIDTAFDLLLTAIATHWDILLQDLRYTVRTLLRSVGFTITAVLVAALGIGATTAAFSLIDHVLIRPLPFPDADRLVKLYEDQSPVSWKEIEPSPANYRDWKRLSKSFEGMAAYRGLSVNMVGQGNPEQVEGAVVNANVFPMLGAQPSLGRIFAQEDDRDGAPGTVVVSYGYWKHRFYGDPSILGKKLTLGGYVYTVIGVMSPHFYFPRRDVKLWTPMRFAESDFQDRSNNYLQVLAKLRPGVSLEQARAEFQVISTQLKRQYPKENAHVAATLYSLHDDLSGRRPNILLIAVLGAALCVLLIACTNLANLLLARALVRRKEIAVRTAMGAGRERLVRQMLTESVVLAVSGGSLGIVIASAATPLLARLVPSNLPIAQVPSIDLRVLFFAALLTIVTGIVFGVAPALRASGGSDVSGLQEGSRQGVGGRRERLRSVLVIAEISASVILLISSGLLIRALWRLQNTDPGFRAEGVLTLRTAMTSPQYEKTSRRLQFYTRVLADVKAIPGVTGAAYTSFLPMVVRGGIWPVELEGKPQEEAGFRQASMRFVTPGYFSTLGIPLRQGRDVRESDTDKALYIAVVSESFVRQYWPSEDPIGRRFKFAFNTRTIVGVVGDVHVRGLERDSEPQVYLPYKQVADGAVSWYCPKDLAIRFSGDPSMLVSAIRRIVASADPEQAVSDVQTLEEILQSDTTPRLIQVRLLGAFAAIAFILAGIGIHGLLSFAVSHRAQEIGVRIAMGARSSDIMSMILRDGFLLASAGISIGALLAYTAGRVMESLLAGVQPGDPPTFAAGVVLALLMTLAGSFFPALRAIRVDPMTAIRAE